MASFAFRLAREETDNLKASYVKGKGSRQDLIDDPTFAAAFETAKQRVRNMDYRFVSEPDPLRQTLLEVYCAVALGVPYADFDTH